MIRKGFYFIITGDTDKAGKHFNSPSLSEGSYEYHGKLFIHRAADFQNHPQRWKVSHVSSGGCIAQHRTLKEAREIAKGLQGFRLWEVEGYDDLCKAIKLHHLGYQEEVERIKSIAAV